jgi:hypothetical protein
MKTYARPLQALLIAVPLLIGGGVGLHHAQAQQQAASPLHFRDVPNEYTSGGFRVTATRCADVPGQPRVMDGRVEVKALHPQSRLKVTSTADGLQFSQVGPSGTPSDLLPLAYMPFHKASMTVEFRPGVTIFRDGTGHSATVYAYGIHAH